MNAIAFVTLAVLVSPARAQDASATLETKLQAKLDEFRAQSSFPGATFGLATRAGVRIALATGVADRDTKVPICPRSVAARNTACA
jgi:hypothetical protein